MKKVNSFSYKVENSKNFIDSISSNNYFVFAASFDKKGEINDSIRQKREFLERTIFGYKVEPDDVKHLLPINSWTSNTFYDAYDDSLEIENPNIFVTVLSGEKGEGPYRVFKCLDNNNGSKSQFEPLSPLSANSSFNVSNYEIQMPDGYIWKYMFAVSAGDYEIHGTVNEIPYTPFEPVINSAKENITRIEIVSTETALFKEYNHADEKIISVQKLSDEVDQYDIEIRTSIEPKSIEDSYKYMYLRIPDIGGIYDILKSFTPNSTPSNRILTVRVQTSEDLLGVLTNCSIHPKIEISRPMVGGTQALAYGELSTEGTLNRVVLFNKGSMYKNSKAILMLPINLSSNTILRTINSPTGGHGSDPIQEMNMNKVSLVTTIRNTSLNSIPAFGTYTRYGLVKDPIINGTLKQKTFDNRLKLVSSSNNVSLNSGDIVTQIVNDETISAKVYNVVQNFSNSEIYLVDYVGPFQNTFQSGYINSITSGAIPINISNTDQNYVEYTGKIVSFLEFNPIERTSSTKEKFRFEFTF